MPIEVYHDGYFKSEKYKRNIKMLEVELEQNPDDSYTIFQLGKEYRIIKEYAKANVYLTRCYKSITNNDVYKPQVVIEYLHTFLELKDFEQGLTLIEKEKHYLIDYPDFFASGVFFMELVFSDTDKYFKYFPLIEESYLKCLSVGDTTNYESVKGTGSFLAAYNLAVFYETTGDLVKAKTYYQISAEYNYKLAQNRLDILNKK